MNARISSQFWPLVQAVDGRSTYEALFQPRVRRGSRPGRLRELAGVAIELLPARLRGCVRGPRVPDREDGLELLVGPASDSRSRDETTTQSYRLAIFDEPGETRAEAVERCRERASRLLAGFDLDPVATALPDLDARRTGPIDGVRACI